MLHLKCINFFLVRNKKGIRCAIFHDGTNNYLVLSLDNTHERISPVTARLKFTIPPSMTVMKSMRTFIIQSLCLKVRFPSRDREREPQSKIAHNYRAATDTM